MKLILSILTFTVFFSACKEPYEPIVDKNDKNLLVVEGYINTGGGQTSIRLSRTLDLKGGKTIQEEVGATLRIEGEDGSFITAVTNNEGMAKFASSINNAQRYKLLITTKSGRKYTTAFLENKRTPEIEEIGYKPVGQGIQLYVNTEDNSKNTRYYRWTFDETWEIVSPFRSFLQYVGGKVISRDMSINITHCWQTSESQILVGSSEKLSADRINELPLVFINSGSIKLSKLYSIKVLQYGLTKEAYDYLSRVKKNTENIGSIFDPQPSELTGNIKGVSDPSETVVGFMSCGSVKEKRIFISPSEIFKINPEWFYRDHCLTETVESPEGLLNSPMYKEYLIIDVIDLGPTTNPPPPTLYTIAPKECIDCRFRGTNIKPSYWP